MKLTETALWLWKGKSPQAVRLRWLLKMSILVALFVALFWFIPIEDVLHAMLTADPLYLALGMAGGFLIIYLTSLQYRLLLKRQGIPLSVAQLLNINLVVKFYLLFLPGDLVGSGLKWYKISQPYGKKAEALAAVAFYRLIEIFMTVCLGLVFWLLSGQRSSIQVSGGMLVALFLAITLVWFILTRTASPLAGWFGQRAEQETQHSFWQNLLRKIEKMLLAVANYSDYPVWELLLVILVAMSQDLVNVVSYQLLARSVGVEISLIDMGWIQSVVILASMLPIAVAGGLGVREVTLVAVLATFGVAPQSALAFSLLLFVRGVLLGVAGGLIEAIQTMQMRRAT